VKKEMEETERHVGAVDTSMTLPLALDEGEVCG
jgi:hypothetical protein